MPAKPLTPEQKADASRLMALFKQQAGITQASLADDLGFANQSAVSQYLNGKIPLNVEAAVKFATRFGCAVSDFSTSIQDEIDRIAQFSTKGDVMDEKKPVVAHIQNIPSKSYAPKQPEAPGGTPFSEFFSEFIDDGSAIFRIMDVMAACGSGVVNSDYPETVRTLVMSPSEARRLIGSTNKSGAIRVIVASKDSMVPTIKPDDLLFVDTSITEYSGEAVYILRHGGELVCKRLSLVGSTLTVSSDNPAYKSWPWTEKHKETAIVGRVLRALPMTFTNFGSSAEEIL